jgi:predicted GNAT family acetyltransferase
MVSLSSDFTSKEIHGFGTQISNEFGHISVITGAKFTPALHSVTDFVVKEEHRGKGHGNALIAEAVRRYGTDIGGQCSSAASVVLFFKYGFRMLDEPNHSLKDALVVMKENSSVYMKLVK